MSRYRHVSAMKAEGFPVQAACAAAEVSTSAYYDWLATAGGPTDAEWDEAVLVNEMIEVHRTLDDTYGSPPMTGELARRGMCANHKRIERLMAVHGIYATDGRRRKVRTTTPDISAPPLPDLVKRDFSVGEPGQRTCGDITYIPTDEGWLHLADVLDLGSRRIVGFAMGERMPTELVASAMTMAIAARGGEVEGMVFHHDRGGSRGSSGASVRSTGSPSRWAGSDRPRTTRSPSPSGPRSSESSSPVSGSARGPMPVGRSSPGSAATTPCGCTRPSATSRRSSGKYASSTVSSWPHSNVSG